MKRAGGESLLKGEVQVRAASRLACTTIPAMAQPCEPRLIPFPGPNAGFHPRTRQGSGSCKGVVCPRLAHRECTEFRNSRERNQFRDTCLAQPASRLM
eukprot:2600315-Pyramimonas_sp.AAC.1